MVHDLKFVEMENKTVFTNSRVVKVVGRGSEKSETGYKAANMDEQVQRFKEQQEMFG